MGTRKQSYRIKDRGPNFTKTVIFWHPKKKRQIERSTGEKDPERAAVRAAQIFAEELGDSPQASGGQQCVDLPTEELANDWIESQRNVLDDGTLAAYALTFSTHLVPVFKSIRDITKASVRAYIARRLKFVQGSTVRKELSPLRGLVAWCEDSGIIEEAPVIPGVPKRAVGNAYRIEKDGEWVEVRRRAKPDELSPKEIRTIIDALPKWVNGKPIQSRYRLQYSMGLRSHTVAKLELGIHWRRGSDWLELVARSLKDRVADKRRLTRDAKDALTEASEGLTSGLIFGDARSDTDHRRLIRAAALKALGEDRGSRFAPTHLRSAAITHFLDAGAPLTAGAKFAGHKLVTTTDRYARPSQRALEAEMKRQRRY